MRYINTRIDLITGEITGNVCEIYNNQRKWERYMSNFIVENEPADGLDSFISARTAMN